MSHEDDIIVTELNSYRYASRDALIEKFKTIKRWKLLFNGATFVIVFGFLVAGLIGIDPSKFQASILVFLIIFIQLDGRLTNECDRIRLSFLFRFGDIDPAIPLVQNEPG